MQIKKFSCIIFGIWFLKIIWRSFLLEGFYVVVLSMNVFSTMHYFWLEQWTTVHYNEKCAKVDHSQLSFDFFSFFVSTFYSIKITQFQMKTERGKKNFGKSEIKTTRDNRVSIKNFYFLLKCRNQWFFITEIDGNTNKTITSFCIKFQNSMKY